MVLIYQHSICKPGVNVLDITWNKHHTYLDSTTYIIIDELLRNVIWHNGHTNTKIKGKYLHLLYICTWLEIKGKYSSFTLHLHLASNQG